MPDTRFRTNKSLAILGTIVVLGAAGPAWAHDAAGGLGGLATGFMHPLLGWDHLVAMVAVGIWAAVLGGRAVRRLPLAFLLLMAIGGAFGMAGIELPAVEAGIAASAVVLGLVVAAALAPSPTVAAAIVAVFAILHGNAHGMELPQAASPPGYCVGFLVATALLHLVGIGIAGLARWPAGRLAVRATGGAIALSGTALLFGLA
jgi:urease accessory protein